MRFWRHIVLFLMGAALLRAGVEQIPPRKAMGDTDGSFAQQTATLLEGLAMTDRWEIYEGLPSDGEGREFLENEKRTKPVLLLDDNWFYLRAQSVAEDDQRQLQRLCAGGLFKPWGGVKFCGGFHADYAVSFKSDEKIHVLLFCLGCHEARILAMPAETDLGSAKTISRLTVDLEQAQYAPLRTILLKYRKDRPLAPREKTAVPMPPVPPPVPVRL